MPPLEKDEEFLNNVLRGITLHPFTITRVVDEMGVLLTLDLHKEDMGRVIGKSGQTAKAIRTLLRVVGMQNQARVNLKINEPQIEQVSSPGLDIDLEDIKKDL